MASGFRGGVDRGWRIFLDATAPGSAPASEGCPVKIENSPGFYTYRYHGINYSYVSCTSKFENRRIELIAIASLSAMNGDERPPGCGSYKNEPRNQPPVFAECAPNRILSFPRSRMGWFASLHLLTAHRAGAKGDTFTAR